MRSGFRGGAAVRALGGTGTGRAPVAAGAGPGHWRDRGDRRDLAPDGEIFALIEGDLSAPPVLDAPEPVLSGGTFLLSASGTPGFDLVADFVIAGVGGDFDPDVPFLSGVLEDLGHDATLVTLIFGSLEGQAAPLFGPSVLISFFDFGVLPRGDGVFPATGSCTIQAIAPIAPVPLPLPGLMLAGGLAGLAQLRRHRRPHVA